MQRAKPGETVIGWKLDRDQRKELLLQFPPKFSERRRRPCDAEAAVRGNSRLPCPRRHRRDRRPRDDGKGVEAMVVSINGTTDRPDGSTYHITWSLEAGRRAKESNDVIAKLGWEPIELPMPVKLEPARFLMRQLYLDCDGVLADFDKGATAILGMKPKAFEKRHGLGRFWAEAGERARFLLQPAAAAGRDASCSMR
jgi:hypothetical protein